MHEIAWLLGLQKIVVKIQLFNAFELKINHTLNYNSLEIISCFRYNVKY